VVEVHVREHDVSKVLERDPEPRQLLLQSRQSRRGTGVDDDRRVAGKDVGANRPRQAEVIQVDADQIGLAS
jgi:hypothetical protein